MPAKRAVLATIITGALAALTPAAAHAGTLVADGGACSAQPLSQPFAPWLDYAAYTPAPGGAAESAAGWTLSNGAAIADGNEPWQVGGPADTAHVELPAGSSATTGTICVGLGHPTLRGFTKSSGTLLGSLLAVDVLFETASGDTVSLPIALLTPSSNWQPTLPMAVVASLLALLPSDTTPVAFRFTPLGLGSWSIDDLYVDPWRNG